MKALEDFLFHSRFKGIPSIAKEQQQLEENEILLKTCKLSRDLLHDLRHSNREGRAIKNVLVPVGETNLQMIYPSTGAYVEGEMGTFRCPQAPMTLLIDGKEKLQQLSEEQIAEPTSGSSSKVGCSSLNNKMLTVLNGLRREFETCSTLLVAFMQSQVKVPLVKENKNKYVDEKVNIANTLGLSVWGLLTTPFKYLNNITDLSKKFGQLAIEFTRHADNCLEYVFPSRECQFPDYDQKLKFLVGSMKEGVIYNERYISYSLERQLQDQCKKRNIDHNTPVSDILQQWNANFEEETLMLVPDEYRQLVARWIRWSLMINNVRETLASQTAIGVVGLVNSGKSKLVSSIFPVKTVIGTTDRKRTTVPLIYNLHEHIKGLDVVDFPGVDDRDESTPEMAKLLLSLTRIVVFVVDYRKAHTESTKQWLSILEEENVPVLVCLTFADKLFAELWGDNCDNNITTIRAEMHRELEKIKSKIGSSEKSHQRDFTLAVLAFNNDSKLNSDEGKEKLRQVGLSDELYVGHWIAAKLEDQYESQDLSQNLLKYLREKKSSTLKSHSCKRTREEQKEEIVKKPRNEV
ncbi:uncharacterized protein LOC124434327 [Xenia sp. Carnegie-2017]|uniref:uncharacterized protein LOC124434327 n=1 Tax=Xenia sp. Carnegie-2017 TaxID=2897299 RepID=UPI001F049E75|nr:uncharacterized protein LOC124434327 [Xenia sp. Carnegie-2017]